MCPFDYRTFVSSLCQHSGGKPRQKFLVNVLLSCSVSLNSYQSPGILKHWMYIVQCQQDSSSVINVHIEHAVLLSDPIICINNSTPHHLEQHKCHMCVYVYSTRSFFLQTVCNVHHFIDSLSSLNFKLKLKRQTKVIQLNYSPSRQQQCNAAAAVEEIAQVDKINHKQQQQQQIMSEQKQPHESWFDVTLLR